MWVCFNDAFISIVEDKKQPGVMKVRARKRIHLKRLFPDCKIHTTKKTDYAHRVFVTREQVAAVVNEAIMGQGKRAITYDNFKNSVKDDALHDLYSDFWTLHYRYQHADDKPKALPWWDESRRFGSAFR